MRARAWRAMASADFAPGFSFDFQEQDVAAAAPQAPWEFGGETKKRRRSFCDVCAQQQQRCLFVVKRDRLT